MQRVQELLSSVSQNVSEIELKMFSLPVKSKSEFLPKISTILSQLQCLISNNFIKTEMDVSSHSLSWDSDHDYPEYCEESSFFNSSFFSFSCDEENVMESTRRDEEDKFIASTRTDKDDKFISSMVMFISKASPALIYSRSKADRRRRKRIQKSIHGEMQIMVNV